MQPFRSNSQEINLPPPLFEHLDPDFLLSLATLPLVGVLVANRLVSHWLIQIGVASEEVFRGERLPVLTPPLLTAFVEDGE